MRFVNQTAIKALSEACVVAHRLIESRDSKLHEAVSAKNYFMWARKNYETEHASGADCSARLRGGPTGVKVYTYRPLNPFTRAIAMTNGDGAIHFNIYKVHKRSLVELVATINHEYGHLCGFGHGSNYKTKAKCLYSLPYYLSENVSKWI